MERNLNGEAAYGHRPIMLRETLELLTLRPDAVCVDLTLGRAGHGEAILRAGSGVRLIGVDRDEAAIEAARERLAAYGDRVRLVRGDFRTLGAILDDLGCGFVDGILMDLGVSSPQLDEAARGFSYMKDAPLDMRMDRRQALMAADVVNGYGEFELRRILADYGEERYAGRIAAAIVRNRPVETTFELVGIIKSAMPKKALMEKQHPAKRSFQAIRMEVNDELPALEEALAASAPRLKAGGRLVVITFHSLEDRIVKQFIRKRENPCTCPSDFPVCVCGNVPDLKGIGRKPVTASAEEIMENPRARSAKLRAAEKISEY